MNSIDDDNVGSINATKKQNKAMILMILMALMITIIK